MVLILLAGLATIGLVHCGTESGVEDRGAGQRVRSSVSDSAAFYLRRGRLYMKEHVYTRAVEQLTHAVRLDSASAEAQSMLGLAYALRLKPGKALPHIEKAIANDPANGIYHMHLGKAYMLLTDYDNAKVAYGRAIELGLKRGKPYYDLGIINEREGRLEVAEAFYETAIKMVPRLAAPCNLRLGIIAEKRGDSERAIELLAAALESDPDLTGAHYRIGQLYLEAGNDVLADFHLKQFRRLKVAEGHAGG